MSPASKNRLDEKIGGKLRRGELLDGAEEADFRSFLVQHDDALNEVIAILRRINDPSTGRGLDPTPRVKTRRTTIEKLQRGTRLTQIHDIAGARIIVDGSRNRQDAVCTAICAAFPEHLEPVDRRVDPSFGYRAVHVVVRHGDCWVEIQIRTNLQHHWAETIERLADAWGRQIRYGSPPNDPDAPWGTQTRAEALASYTNEWSRLISEVEEIEQDAEFQMDADLTKARVASVEAKLESLLLGVRAAATQESEGGGG